MEEETKKQIWIFAFMLVIGVAIILAVILLSNNDKQGFAVISNERTMTPLAGKTYAQLSWNNVNLIDSTNYNSQSNICTAQRFGMEVTISPCKAQDADGKNIQQDVQFKWSGANTKNISWIFVYDNDLSSGTIEALVNKSYETTEMRNTWVNNYLVDGVVSYTNLTQQPMVCDLGNTNNTQFYNVTRNKNGTIFNQIVCFSERTVVNATAFRISGNTDLPTQVTKYQMTYVDVTDKVQFLGKGLLGDSRSYYKVNSVSFSPGEIINTKWRFTPKDSEKAGKWHILGYETETGLVSSIQNNLYIYVDPWWDTGWIKKIPITISTTDATNIVNQSVYLNISYDSDMQADFDDLRFLDSSESTELGYWFYNNTYLASNSVKVYVRIPQSLNSSANVTIWMYYGNAGATTTSSVANAFLFGDDFSTLDWTSKWQSTNQGLYSVSGGILTIGGTGTASQLICSNRSFSNGYVLESRDYSNAVNAGNSLYHLPAAATPTYNGALLDTSSNAYRYDFNGGGSGTGGTALANVYQIWNLKIPPSGAANFSIWNDGKVSTRFSAVSGTMSSYSGYVCFLAYQGTEIGTMDWVYVREYSTAEPTGTLGAEESLGIVVTLNSPANGDILTTANFSLNHSLQAFQINYTNYTIYLWYANGSIYDTEYSPQTGNSNWTITTPVNIATTTSLYLTWNVEACGQFVGGSHGCFWDSANNTFLVDVAEPIITIHSPLEKQIFPTRTAQLNWTVVDGSLQACWYRNMSSGLNVTVACSANTTTLDIPSFGTDQYILFYANDSTARTATARVNFTAVNTTYSAPVYSANTFDTVTNIYQMTIQKSPNVTAIPTLWYNGTAVTNYSEVSNGVFNISYQIPAFSQLTDYNRTNSFYINWSLSYLNGSQYNQSSYSFIRNQTVYQILLNYCGGIFQTKAINLTFIDEALNTPTNATLDASSFTYSAASTGTGIVKSFTFANTTSHNMEYDFCIYPTFAPTITVNGLLQASKSDTGTYPQRKYYMLDLPISNVSTHIVMYLLNVNNGITSSYQTITIGNQVIPNAYIKLEREIAGVTVKVADGYTDSSGIMTAFLNPNYQHTLTASKTGYASQTHTIYPSQSIYTITMGSSADYFYYNNTVEGLTWAKWPPSGMLTDGIYNFSFTINSRSSNIYGCSFYIKYPNTTILTSATGCNTTTPNTGGQIFASVNATRLNDLNITRIYGEYYVNTSYGLTLIEKDANWRLFDGNYSDYYGTMKNFLNESYNLPEWGDNPDTRDFSRIVFFFLFLAIALAILNFFTGYDTAYPGSFLYLVTGIVFIASAMGGVQGPGWFYLEGAVNLSNVFGDDTVSRIFNNWILFVHFALLSAIYYFTTNKRYQVG